MFPGVRPGVGAMSTAITHAITINRAVDHATAQCTCGAWITSAPDAPEVERFVARHEARNETPDDRWYALHDGWVGEH